MSTFDPQDLDQLAEDVSDRPFAVSFVQKYRSLLPTRVLRITEATEAQDLDRAMDATRSLRVASATVGTHELAEMAHVVEGRLRRRDFAGAQARARLLPDAAQRADDALGSYLTAAGAC